MADVATTGSNQRYTPGYSDRVHDNHAQRTAGTDAEFFLPYLRPGYTLIDVGCGPGSITLDLAVAVEPGPVVGIDIEPLQIERARALASARGITNVRFEVGDASSLPFGGASFDAVFSHAVLMHLGDPLAALKEFRRVLRPGGIVGIRDAAGVPNWEPETPLIEQFRTLHRRLVEHNRGRPTGVLDFRQRRLLLDAGFARAEGFAQMRSSGTPETVRQVSGLFAHMLDESWRQTVIEQGWVDGAQVDAMVAELLAWGDRPDSFGTAVWCAAVGWVDGDESGAGR